MSVNRKSLQFIPVSLNITGKKILIIGGGKVALHKLTGIKHFSDNITILAPLINDEIITDPSLKFRIKYYERKDLRNYDLIYACTDNEEVNATIKKDASSQGLLVNVADSPELCDFVSPAIYTDGIITVAVSSGARDVKKAIQIRNTIKEFLLHDKTGDI